MTKKQAHNSNISFRPASYNYLRLVIDLRRSLACKCRQGAAGFLAALFLCCGVSVHVKAEESTETLELSAQSAVLITADSKLVLYDRFKDEKLPMASTTKIMTALLALEKAEEIGDPVVDITREMVMVEGSSMGLREGDRLQLSGIVQGMMLCSGNDAANAIALFIGGSAEGFAALMNSRAAEIGMKHTNFVTASGLDDENHYTTAYDMALLGAAAMQNPQFAEICASKKLNIRFENPEKTVWLSNHNKLLGMYEGCVGMKTGYTKKSGRCLVSAATRNGVTLIAVTLNAADDWQDHTKMLDMGFAKTALQEFDESGFSAEVPVAGTAGDSNITVQGINGGAAAIYAEDAAALRREICLPAFVYAPVSQGETVGTITYYAGSVKVCSLPLKAATSVAYEKKRGLWERIFHLGD